MFHSENASDVFRALNTGEMWKATVTGHFEFAFEKKIGQGNHVIIVTTVEKL